MEKEKITWLDYIQINDDLDRLIRKLQEAKAKWDILGAKDSKYSESGKSCARELARIQNRSHTQCHMLKNSLDSMLDQKIGVIEVYYWFFKNTIDPFLDSINVFEHQLNILIESNEDLRNLLKERIDKKINLMAPWIPTGKKEKNFKTSLINQYQRKIYETQFIRDTLYKYKIISVEDRCFLEFCWDVRNSIHHNFRSLKDINYPFKTPDGTICEFTFYKGRHIKHPDANSIYFYLVSERISHLAVEIIEHFENNKS